MNAEQLRERLKELEQEERALRRQKVTVEVDMFRIRTRLVYEFKQYDVFGDEGGR